MSHRTLSALLTALIKSEIAKWQKVARAAGLKPQ